MIRINQGGAPAPAPELAAARSFRLTWPATLMTSVAPSVGAAGDLNGHTGNNASPMFTRTGVPGDVFGYHKGRPCVRLPSPGVAGASLQSAVNFPLALEAGPPSSAGLSPARMFGRLQTELARSATGGTAGVGHGVVIGYRSAGAIGIPPAAGAFHFGVVGDGVTGGWRWASYVGGAEVESVPLTWPVATDEWCALDYRLYPADATQAGRVEVWIAGARHITRSWGPGSILPTPTGSVVNQIMFGFSLRNAALGMPDLCFGGLAYTLAGVEDIA